MLLDGHRISKKKISPVVQLVSMSLYGHCTWTNITSCIASVYVALWPLYLKNLTSCTAGFYVTLWPLYLKNITSCIASSMLLYLWPLYLKHITSCIASLYVTL